MLIRSKRPFQNGGKRETIVLEERRPLKVSEKRNGGWKQTVVCQESPHHHHHLPHPTSLSAFMSLLLSFSLVSVNSHKVHSKALKSVCLIATPFSQSIFISTVSHTFIRKTFQR